MGDHDDSHAELFLQILHQLQDLRLYRHIESRRRLIRDEKLRLTGQGDGDHDPLAHPPGKLMGILPKALLRLIDPHELQQLSRPLPDLCPPLLRVEADGLLDLISDRPDRVQGGHRILENDAHLAAADLSELLLLHLIDAVPVEFDASADDAPVLRREAHDRVGRDRLPGAGLPHDSEDLPLLHPDADII